MVPLIVGPATVVWIQVIFPLKSSDLNNLLPENTNAVNQWAKTFYIIPVGHANTF